MRVKATLLAGICAGAVAVPVHAQSAADSDLEDPRFNAPTIIVTAQRQNQTLQEVPIAVSAFDAEALEAQQIENASDLQLTLPNVSFTKSNFTASSFTIRGIGDLCVGVTCDSATAIHQNGAPLFGTRLFETAKPLGYGSRDFTSTAMATRPICSTIHPSTGGTCMLCEDRCGSSRAQIPRSI